MAPEIQRPDPPYLQLVAHYRALIRDGDLKSGERIPASRDLAKEWGVAHTTVAKAISLLRAEGLVVTSTQGVKVAFGETSTYTPRDRLNAIQRTGWIYPRGEYARILAADVVPAPDYVAEAMGVAEGDSVVRRERVSMHGDDPVTYSVTWMPGDLADQVPALMQTERIPGGTVGAVRDATGRSVDFDSDVYRMCARSAPAEVAEALGVAEGDPVIYVQSVWPEATGTVLEFGESFTTRWISGA